MQRTLFLLLSFCLLSAWCFSAPSMRISKPVALIDEEISIELKGLKPFQHVTIHAETKDANGEKWCSEAVYCSDHRGRLRLSRTAPLDGSYEGVDGMGLFWSMLPDSGTGILLKIPDEMIVHIDVIVDRYPILSREIKRLKKAPEVKRFSIKEKGLVGALYMPPSLKPLPVIITLSGFLGGQSETKAQLLASHGFAVLALAYFGMEGLPEKLENIPLEYFGKAFEWIQAQPDLDATRIGLFGSSRGGELALLLGTLYSHQIKAISAIVPSSIIFGSLENQKVPAWTFEGKPLNSFAAFPTIEALASQGKDPEHPLVTTPLVLQALKNHPAGNSATIPVEKIRCPLLLISGGEDQVWPSSLFVSQIKERLANKKAKVSLKIYDYPKAGHQIGIPFIPPDSLLYYSDAKLWFALGGTTQATERASRDAWRKNLVFFQNKLL